MYSRSGPKLASSDGNGKCLSASQSMALRWVGIHIHMAHRPVPTLLSLRTGSIHYRVITQSVDSVLTSIATY